MGVIRRCGVQDLVIRAEPQDRVRHLIGRLTLRKMADALQHQPLVTPAEVVLASAGAVGVGTGIRAAVQHQGRQRQARCREQALFRRPVARLPATKPQRCR